MNIVVDAESAEKKLSEKADTPTELQDNEDNLLIIKKHRENIHSVLAYSNATPIRGYWGSGYVCGFCPEQFALPSALKKHTLTHANYPTTFTVTHVRTHVARLDVTGLKCSICNTKMEDMLSLMYHLQRQHKKPMHFDINNHIIPFKFDTVELECIECEKKFSNFKLLSEHMANIHYRNYVCGKCDRGFVNRVHLVAHKDTHKTGKFNCDFCAKHFDTRRKKTTHERIKHTLQSKYEKCGYCKMSFQNAAQRNNHELRTHRKQITDFKCTACDKSYARQRSLREHIKRVHLVHRPYKCTVQGCEKSFYLNRTLQAHILTHADGRPFPCRLCPKSYRSLKSLKGHMYIHTDKKEFKCLKCYKTYVHEDNLTRHMHEKHSLED